MCVYVCVFICVCAHVRVCVWVWVWMSACASKAKGRASLTVLNSLLMMAEGVPHSHVACVVPHPHVACAMCLILMMMRQPDHYHDDAGCVLRLVLFICVAASSAIHMRCLISLISNSCALRHAPIRP